MTTKAKALELAHRIAWRYKKSSDPAHSDTFTFNESTLLQFVGALAQQSVPTDARDGINGPFNACMFREHCRSMLAAAPVAPLTEQQAEQAPAEWDGLPELPKPYQDAITATAKNTPAVRAGYEEAGYEKSPNLYTAEQMHSYARAAITSNVQPKHTAEPFVTSDMLRAALDDLKANHQVVPSMHAMSSALHAALAAAPTETPTQEPDAWQERQEVRPGVFGEWYDKSSGWSLTRPQEIDSGGIRYQFRPLYAAPVQSSAPAPDGLTGEQLDGIRQALLDTAKDPHDIDEADRIVERILSSFKPATQAPAVGAEPVAKVVSWTNGSYWRNYKLTWMEGGDYLDTGALLYATPPDHTAAMRQALEALVGNCTNPAADPEQAAAEDAAIAKLRAALGESKPPVQGSEP